MASDQFWLNVRYPTYGAPLSNLWKKDFPSKIVSMFKEVCVEVHFQQHENGKIHRHLKGLPKGGKCSAELADLFCLPLKRNTSIFFHSE